MLFTKKLLKKIKNLPQRDPFGFIKERMDRPDWKTTPPEVADRMRDIIQGKVVCDLGARKGYFMLDLIQRGKPRKVIGIERKEHLCRMCWKKGLNVIRGDFFKEIPEADIYFTWLGEENIKKILKKLGEENRGKKLVVWKGVSDDIDIFDI